MTELLAIAAGGAFGAVARHVLGNAVGAWLGAGFPWGTLSVNVAGGCVAGALLAAMGQGLSIGPADRAFLFVGFLGGFTTFSAFSIETLRLLDAGDSALAAAYVAASVALSVGGVAGGFKLVRWLGA